MSGYGGFDMSSFSGMIGGGGGGGGNSANFFGGGTFDLSSKQFEELDLSSFSEDLDLEMQQDIQELEPREEQQTQNTNNMANAGLIQGGVQMLGEGSMNLAKGLSGGKARRAEQGKANREHSIMRQRYMSMDTSNPYENLINPYENLTVNQQEAEFESQQHQQSLANTMGALQGAAGGSGIAGLAQVMANQQSRNLQRSSASIGMQERENRIRWGAYEGRRQMEGERLGREWEQDKTETLYGVAQQRKGASDEAIEAARVGAIGGALQTMHGVGMVIGGAFSGGSDRRLKKNIKLIGYSPNGLKIYIFEYINKMFGEGIWQGVMSDEIPQHAVIKHKDGYDRVDYSKLDVEFKQINHGK